MDTLEQLLGYIDYYGKHLEVIEEYHPEYIEEEEYIRQNSDHEWTEKDEIVHKAWTEVIDKRDESRKHLLEMYDRSEWFCVRLKAGAYLADHSIITKDDLESNIKSWTESLLEILEKEGDVDHSLCDIEHMVPAFKSNGYLQRLASAFLNLYEKDGVWKVNHNLLKKILPDLGEESRGILSDTVISHIETMLDSKSGQMSYNDYFRSIKNATESLGALLGNITLSEPLGKRMIDAITRNMESGYKRYVPEEVLRFALPYLDDDTKASIAGSIARQIDHDLEEGHRIDCLMLLSRVMDGVYIQSRDCPWPKEFSMEVHRRIGRDVYLALRGLQKREYIHADDYYIWIEPFAFQLADESRSSDNGIRSAAFSDMKSIFFGCAGVYKEYRWKDPINKRIRLMDEKIHEVLGTGDHLLGPRDISGFLRVCLLPGLPFDIRYRSAKIVGESLLRTVSHYSFGYVYDKCTGWKNEPK